MTQESLDERGPVEDVVLRRPGRQRQGDVAPPVGLEIPAVAAGHPVHRPAA